MGTLTDQALRRLPKAELHVHLDGSLRASTMIELARERRVPLPHDEADALARYMVVDDAACLEEYLERFAITLSVMQDVEALERIAYECVLDHAAEGVRYVEVRYCPLLNTAQGLTPAEVVEATLRGLRRGETDARTHGTGMDGDPPGIEAQLIVCALRSHEPARTVEMAEVAASFVSRGVCGFDIAGAEAGHPVSDHREAFDRAHAAGVPITIHAGEGFGPASIRQALDLGHARRIGHGTRLREDPALQEDVARRGVPLEVCLTSNVQTRVVASHADHPAGVYLRAGIPVSLGTDNRLMSGVTLVDEYRHARDDLGLTAAELISVARAGFLHAFVDAERRDRYLRAFDAEVETRGWLASDAPS
jgi:adenosine deaminase